MRESWYLVLLLAWAGCSGGSGGAPQDALFAGDYLACWALAQTGERSARADVRRVQADGRGTYATDFEPDSRFDERIAYTLSADGALNGPAGILGPEGAFYSAGDLKASDDTLGIGIGIRLDREADQGAVTGEYFACAISFETAGGAVVTEWSELRSEASLALVSGTLVRSDGGTSSATRLYNVHEGYLVVEGGPVGGVTAGGSIFAIADQHGAAGATSFLVAVRQSTTAGIATLGGAYVCFGFVTDGTEVTTRRAVLEADGAGEARITEASSDGAGRFRLGSYSVAEDGGLGLDDGRTGVVSEDGSVFALVDADATDGEISIWVGVRRS